jgi:hypothetical protein
MFLDMVVRTAGSSKGIALGLGSYQGIALAMPHASEL